MKDSRRAKIFLWKQSVLFSEFMMWVYGKAEAVNEHRVVTDLKLALNEALKLKDGPSALSFTINCLTYALIQVYIILQIATNLCKDRQGFSLLLDSRIYSLLLILKSW